MRAKVWDENKQEWVLIEHIATDSIMLTKDIEGGGDEDARKNMEQQN